MNTRLNHVHALLAITLALTTPTFAGDVPSVDPLADAGSETTCHHLMTEKECGQFLATLVRLPQGEMRQRFLAAHADLMHEREAACDCTRLNAQPVVYRSSLRVVRQF